MHQSRVRPTVISIPHTNRVNLTLPSTKCHLATRTLTTDTRQAPQCGFQPRRVPLYMIRRLSSIGTGVNSLNEDCHPDTCQARSKATWLEIQAGDTSRVDSRLPLRGWGE